MNAKFWQKGEVLDYKASAAVSNGEVVSLGTRIGVAGDNIAAGATGPLHVVGVFEMEKATGAVTMGAALYMTPPPRRSPPWPPPGKVPARWTTFRRATRRQPRQARTPPCW